MPKKKYKHTAWSCVKEIAKTRQMQARATKYKSYVLTDFAGRRVGTINAYSGETTGYFNRFQIWSEEPNVWHWDEKIQLCDAKKIVEAVKQAAKIHNCAAYLMDESEFRFSITNGVRCIGKFTMADGFQIDEFAALADSWSASILYVPAGNNWIAVP